MGKFQNSTLNRDSTINRIFRVSPIWCPNFLNNPSRTLKNKTHRSLLKIYSILYLPWNRFWSFIFLKDLFPFHPWWYMSTLLSCCVALNCTLKVLICCFQATKQSGAPLILWFFRRIRRERVRRRVTISFFCPQLPTASCFLTILESFGFFWIL